ncbi:MAG: hypothetical protein ACWGQW_02465 [bacterium]
MKISGYTVIRNGIDLDYCFEECIQSMLPVCDEVVVSDGQSEDGTRDVLKKMEAEDDRIRVVDYAWENPVGDKTWFLRWLNWVRALHLRHPFQLELDADEVLDDSAECHDKIRWMAENNRCAWFDRLNFVKDGRHLIPLGRCIGKWVARLGPSEFEMPSDEAREILPNIVAHAEKHECLRIFHLGFIRKIEAFYKKNRQNNIMWFGKNDDRFLQAEARNYEEWWNIAPWCSEIVEYNGTYPKSVERWMKERGAL